MEVGLWDQNQQDGKYPKGVSILVLMEVGLWENIYRPLQNTHLVSILVLMEVGLWDKYMIDELVYIDKFQSLF